MTPGSSAEPTSWRQFLTDARIGVIATVGEDGQPHAVPVDLLFFEGCVYVWCKRSSRKAKNAQQHGIAAVVAYRGNSGVMVRGPITAIGEEAGVHYGTIKKAFQLKFSDRSDPEDYGNDCLLRLLPEVRIPFGPRLVLLRD